MPTPSPSPSRPFPGFRAQGGCRRLRHAHARQNSLWWRESLLHCGGRHGADAPFEAFVDPEAYYATLLHELAYWTMAPGCLVHRLGCKRWGDEGYALEELVAEVTAAFLCADLGLSHQPRDEHAAYIAEWLKVLKNDNRAILKAAAYAQDAADYLHRLQPAAAKFVQAV